MGFTTRNAKQLSILLLSLIIGNAVFCKPAHSSVDFYGEWKCVKHTSRGLTRLSEKQAREIRKSTLHIDNSTYYFEHINFVEHCTFDQWKTQTYADMGEPIQALELSNTAIQLKHIILLNTINKDGKMTCYNNWILLKQGKKLITVCAGDTFYWSRFKPKKPSL